MNYQVPVPVGLYARLAKYAHMHSISPVDAVYTCVVYALPIVEAGDDLQVPLMRLNADVRQPQVRIPLDLHDRILTQARRMIALDEHGIVANTGSRVAIIKLCLRVALDAAGIPKADALPTADEVPFVSMKRKAVTLDSLLVLPLPARVLEWLQSKGTTSAQVRAAIDAELEAAAADATITRATARMPPGAAGWNTISLRITPDMHTALREAARARGVPIAQMARICVLKNVNRRVAAASLPTRVPAPQPEGAPA